MEMLEIVGEKFRGLGSSRGAKRVGAGIIAGVLLISLILSCSFNVKTNQQAVVLYGGHYAYTAGPGWNFKMPLVSEITKMPGKNVAVPMTLGYKETGKQKYETVKSEAYMLTGDVKIADVEWALELNITDGLKASKATENPEAIIRAIALQQMLGIINRVSLDTAMTMGRAFIETKLTDAIQEQLKVADIGYSLRSVKIQDIQPPSDLQTAYQSINTSKNQAKDEVTTAQTDKNNMITAAQNDAVARKTAADNDKNKVINDAKGEVAKYLAAYANYKDNGEPVKKQMLVQMLEELLPKAKIVIDKGDGTVKYINLDSNRNITTAPSASK